MHTPPPPDLDDRKPLIHNLKAGEIWYRSHQIAHEPLFFGKKKSQRWDAPAGDYGVLYLGADKFCAFMESIGRGVLTTRFVPKSVLQLRGLSKIRIKRALRLIERIACALFDSCAPLVEVTEHCGSWAEQPALLAEILDHYGFGTDL